MSRLAGLIGGLVAHVALAAAATLFLLVTAALALIFTLVAGAPLKALKA